MTPEILKLTLSITCFPTEDFNTVFPEHAATVSGYEQLETELIMEAPFNSSLFEMRANEDGEWVMINHDPSDGRSCVFMQGTGYDGRVVTEVQDG